MVGVNVKSYGVNEANMVGSAVIYLSRVCKQDETVLIDSQVNKVSYQPKAYLIVTGEGIDSQRPFPAIDEVYSFIQIFHSDNGQDGPKNFLLHDWFPLLHISQYSGGCQQEIIKTHGVHTLLDFFLPCPNAHPYGKAMHCMPSP